MQLLSGLKIEEGHYLMRCSSLSSSGEEAVLTLGLRQEECLTPHYKGFEMSKRWALERISGEQGGLYMGIMPTLPRPNWAPDTVVCAQLDALRCAPLAGSKCVVACEFGAFLRNCSKVTMH
jgi:hypothetical protein